MTKIRVLVVDDSVVVRKLVTDVLATDPTIEVAGTAANGQLALAKIPQLKPDLVTLDVEMPTMNGLETLEAIRKEYRKLPVIMFSTLTQRGASATIDALSRGANDYVTKPANVGSVTEAIERLREELVPKIKHWCGRQNRPKSEPPRPVQAPIAAPPREIGKSTNHALDVVVIGVSTGGPNALSMVLPKLPANFPKPILIVQHMPPVFTKLLADRLSATCAIKVSEASSGIPIRPGHAYIAPGDFHLVVKREGVNYCIQTNQEPPENSCRPAVDVLFRSAVNVFGSGTLGIVLTGMGQDGLKGCELIRAAGGQVIAQDEQSSVVWGMPGFVARSGLADQILPLGDIANEIIRRSFRGRIETGGKTA